MGADLGNMNDALLAKFLQGETDSGENQMVERWLAGDVRNRDYLDRLTGVLEMDRDVAAVAVPDTDLSWERFEERANAGRLFEYRRFGNRWLSGVAAILLIGIGFGWFLWYKTGNSLGQRVFSGNYVLTGTLPDGTIVALNRNTDLTFKYGRTGKGRTVDLEQGESFFSVKQDSRRPFVVRYRGCEIEVLGTSFNVRTKDKELEVIVASGRVKVSRAGESVLLGRSEKVSMNVDTGRLRKSANKYLLYDYYFTEGLHVEKTPLWMVTDVLSKKYNVKILIASDELKNRLLTMKIDKETKPEEMLHVLSVVLDCKVTRINGQFIIE